MLDNFRFQVATLGTEDRSRDLRTRAAAVESKRIFRLGGEPKSARNAGRR
jgi:hypothetical protein